jgi:hypothetical protein
MENKCLQAIKVWEVRQKWLENDSNKNLLWLDFFGQKIMIIFLHFSQILT